MGNPITYPILDESVYFQISIRLGFLTSKNVHKASITSDHTNTMKPAHHAYTQTTRFSTLDHLSKCTSICRSIALLFNDFINY